MDLFRILGHSKLKYYHATDNYQLPLRDGSKRSFTDLCKSAIPTCRLSPWLFNGHLQTIWTVTSKTGPEIHYKRKIFQDRVSSYPGSFAVDFVTDTPSTVLADGTLPARTTLYTEKELDNIASDDTRPMVVVLHGLSGGSHEIYLRQFLGPLVENGEWEACVVNSRGCAGSKITSGVLYNARATWDIRHVVRWISQKYPNRPLFGAGFSIGANIMTNYVGEEGSECVFKAAFVCANPWNLDIAAISLRKTWFSREVYSKVMGANMRALVETHKDELLRHTKINIAEIQKVKYLHEFDRVVQCPTWGYPTEGAYYRDASCVDALLGVKVPFLAINSEDDPICTADAIPYGAFEQHATAVLCTTATGGHLGYFQHGGGRWFATAAVKFFNTFINEVHLESVAPVPEDDGIDGAYEPTRRRLHVRIPLVRYAKR